MSLDSLAILLFVRCDGLQQAIKVIVCSVIELLEGVEASSQVDSKPWWVVVAYRSLIQVELMFIVIGEVGNLL